MSKHVTFDNVWSARYTDWVLFYFSLKSMICFQTFRLFSQLSSWVWILCTSLSLLYVLPCRFVCMHGLSILTVVILNVRVAHQLLHHFLMSVRGPEILDVSTMDKCRFQRPAHICRLDFPFFVFSFRKTARIRTKMFMLRRFVIVANTQLKT